MQVLLLVEDSELRGSILAPDFAVTIAILLANIHES